ncbi:MAG: LysR family transcriptional regulator [Methylobacteriaceae bacterium]|nr:LysR family transcriptional regulator [Methylobacteriaceae bacterium]
MHLPAMEQALHVLDLGSFRKAAELLGVQPSVVSRSVRGLEEAIGVGLFQRQTRGAQPTRAGERLLPRIRRVVEEVRLVVRAGQLASEGQEGELSLGVTVSVAGGGARALLKSFLRAHPGVDLRIAEGQTRDHIGRVQALTMDAAVVVGEPSAPGCRVEGLWTEPIIVALPEEHPLADHAQAIAWPTLAAEHFLVSRVDLGPEIQDYIVHHLARLGHHPLIDPRPIGRDVLLTLISLNQGVSLLSGADAEIRFPGIVFRTLADDPLPFSVIWSERNDNPMLRRFMTLARRWSKERAAALNGDASRTPDRSP